MSTATTDQPAGRAAIAASKASMIASGRRARAAGHAPDEPQCAECETYARDLGPGEQLDPDTGLCDDCADTHARHQSDDRDTWDRADHEYERHRDNTPLHPRRRAGTPASPARHRGIKVSSCL